MPAKGSMLQQSCSVLLLVPRINLGLGLLRLSMFDGLVNNIVDHFRRSDILRAAAIVRIMERPRVYGHADGNDHRRFDKVALAQGTEIRDRQQTSNRGDCGDDWPIGRP